MQKKSFGFAKELRSGASEIEPSRFTNPGGI